MIIIQDTQFPIVSVQFVNAVSLADVAEYLAQFDQWLTRKTPFGVLLSHVTDPTQATIEDETVHQAVHRAIVQWGKENQDRLAQHCVGMVLLIEDAAEFAQKQRAAPKTITAIYGCPGQACATRSEAEQWLQQQLIQR
ncbi:hypothetical protein ACN4EG_25165 [Alkalinema pantanalense CENA528]|uniref:hypothetical protein n=1 Tax=Alkalinema pantanalense TaxID=1620705 RepID=UPI003D6DCD61